MNDSISRQAALTALAEAMPSLTTPDGCGQFDHDIQVTDEAYVDCMRIIHDMPSAESELENKIRAIGYTGKEGRIYIGGRLFAVRELAQ